MKSIIVKGLMVPLEEYATVTEDATLYDAVLALEKAQREFDRSRHRHRAILVFDNNNKIVGKLSIFSVMMALEPKYGELEATGMLTRSGYSPDFIKSMLKDKVPWKEPLEFLCDRATTMKVSDIMEVLAEGAYIDEDARLGEAIQQLVVCRYNSMLVTKSDKVVGILRLSDVFAEVCDKIKSCKI